MAHRDIVVVGASAGGVEALGRLVRDFPEDLEAAVFVVLHLPAHAPSALPNILRRAGPLPAAQAVDGEPIQKGRVYVAAPNHHLLVRSGRVHLTTGPTENGHRPAIDSLFRTAALTYGPRVIGVILSGNLDDGTAGLKVVKSRAGIAIVQDPADALYAAMPTSAIEHVDVDHVLPLADIGAMIVRLIEEVVEDTGAVVRPVLSGRDASEEEVGLQMTAEDAGTPSGFTCPECGGGLWEVREGDLARYQCRVGHAFSPDTLLAQYGEAMDAALWAAVRALEERTAFARRMASGARMRGHPVTAGRYESQAQEAEQRAAVVREALLQREAPTLPRAERQA